MRQRGVGLVEVLLSLAILVIAATAFLSAIATSAISVRNMDTRVTATILGRSQLEHTQSQAYAIAPTTYLAMSPLPSGYTVTSNASSISGRDDNIQTILVTVQHRDQTVLSLQDIKINR